MGITQDKLVIILRGQYGSISEASKHIGISPAALQGMFNEPSKRRNLYKYLPELIKATGLSVTELYYAITEHNVLEPPDNGIDN